MVLPGIPLLLLPIFPQEAKFDETSSELHALSKQNDRKNFRNTLFTTNLPNFIPNTVIYLHKKIQSILQVGANIWDLVFEWSKQYFTNERGFSTRENKIHIFKPLCSFLFIIQTRVFTFFLSHPQLKLHRERNWLNNFKSYKVFFFVLTLSCSFEKDFMSASDNFTNLLFRSPFFSQHLANCAQPTV